MLETYQEKTHELRNRILFTLMVLAVYVVGKGIPLYGIDAGVRTGRDAQSVLLSMLSGDRYQETVMALGVMPYINASVLVQVIASMRTSDARARLSHRIMDRWTGVLTLVLGAVFAYFQSGRVVSRAAIGNPGLVRPIVMAEMIGGAMLIYFLCRENTDRGIGASLPPILLNIVDSIVATIRSEHYQIYRELWLLSAVAAAVMLFMENKTVKIPVQRVSVHNIHADKNYIAYKLNPIGVMPVMLATAVMTIPQILLIGLSFAMPWNQTVNYAAQNLVLTKPLGVIVYLCILMAFTVGFSFIMLSPGDTAKQLQRNGDSIVGVYAGKKTSRYLRHTLLRLSILSGLVQCVFMGISLGLSLQGTIPDELSMMPATVMILVSMGCSLAQEIYAYYRYDSYRFFF